MMNRRKFLGTAVSAVAAGACGTGDRTLRAGMKTSGPALPAPDLIHRVENAGSVRPRLVPERPGTTPSYWCTWDTQSYTLESKYIFDQVHGAEHLNETLVFKDPGWITHFYKKVRKDLFVLYDGGWDIPLSVDFTGKGHWHLGSMEVAVDKFPSCKGSPSERLTKLNEMTLKAGWRGAGIWAAAQDYGDGKDGRLLDRTQVERDLRQRARWSREAGVGYWKVDFGARGNDPKYRRLVTDVCREEAPELVVEHARTCGPVNDEVNPWEKIPRIAHHTGRYAPWDDGKILASALELLSFSSVLRTYDVLLQLSVPSTLDRVAQLIKNKPSSIRGSGGLILCEDEVYIAAALGCAMGIMRSRLWKTYTDARYDPYQLNRRADEAVRAVRWQRLAPAFPAWQGEAVLDSVVFMDDWRFEKGETATTWLFGRDVRQGAPARVARRMALPIVHADGAAPYVIASHNPNGSVSVATLPRASKDRGIYLPLVDVEIDIRNGHAPVGVFGRYRSLTMKLSNELGTRRVWAQDLAGDEAVDVSSRLRKQGRSLIFPGSLIDDVGRSAAREGDVSNPGLVVRLM
ncbi:MAG TPA: hypothetical protein VGY31_08745 [Terriglobia bacterium]|nr:hypothetical protein [Terriglobia bacterium]